MLYATKILIEEKNVGFYFIHRKPVHDKRAFLTWMKSGDWKEENEKVKAICDKGSNVSKEKKKNTKTNILFDKK